MEFSTILTYVLIAAFVWYVLKTQDDREGVE